MGASRRSFACGSALVAAAIAAGVGACSRGGAKESGAGGNASADAGAGAGAGAGPGAGADAGAGAGPSAGDAAADDPYVTAEPIAAKSIGHTSYVLKVTLAGGAQAAFKPRSKRPLGDRRYKGEIAAYRLATALGLGNVPRAIPRTFAAAPLRAALPDLDFAAIVDDGDTMRGALIPWIAGYRIVPLEEDAERERWEPWVFGGAAVPDAQRARAAAIATMIAFDYVTANWDRWSGGNVAEDDRGTLLYVDNDGAFYDWPAPKALAAQRGQLERVARWSRRFVEALRRTDLRALRAALGDERPGEPLVSERALAGVDERRREVLAIVAARVKAHGERATFAFE